MTRLFLLLFLLPSLAAAQAYYAPDGSLIIDICGSSSYTCAQDPRAPDSSYAGVGDQTGSISVGDDKTKDVMPSNEDAPNPPAPSATPSLPSTLQTMYLAGGQYFPSFSEACTYYGVYQELTNPTPGYVKDGVVVNSSCYLRVTNLTTGTYVDYFATIGTSQQSVCPVGYTLSGTTCILNDARAAQPDGKEDINRDGGNYSRASPSDADRVLTNDSIAAINGGNYQRSGYDSKGKPVHVEVMAQPTGGTTIIHTLGAAGGGYGVNQTTYNINNYGVVTGVSSNSGDGKLTVSPGTAGASVSGNPGVTTPGSGGQTGSGLNPPTFPSDYAKSGEAAAAAKSITDRLDNTSDVGDPVLPQDQEFGDAFFKDTFTSLLAWQLPAHSSACPVGSFSWDGRIYSVDAHCQLIADHWSLLSQAMAVVWIIAALFIVLRA